MRLFCRRSRCSCAHMPTCGPPRAGVLQPVAPTREVAEKIVDVVLAGVHATTSWGSVEQSANQLNLSRFGGSDGTALVLVSTQHEHAQESPHRGQQEDETPQAQRQPPQVALPLQPGRCTCVVQVREDGCELLQ